MERASRIGVENRRPITKFIAYQKAREASRLINQLIAGWRGAKELVDQAERAAGSMSYNLNEGSTRPPGSPDRMRYYRYAWGSACELEGILDVAEDRGLGPADQRELARSLCGEVARILSTIVRRSDPDD
jgi:four helix bundle protein